MKSPVSASRDQLIKALGSAMADLGVKDPSEELLEPIARVVTGLVK